MRICRPLVFLLAAALVTGPALACQVPVFRYALERWIPDNYIIDSPSKAPEENRSNLTYKQTDGDSLTLRYPKTTGIADSFWSGAFTPENLAKIPDSPLRQEILRRILSGDSAVWLLVESGNPEKDKAAIATLESALDKATETLELPEGIVGVEEARLRKVSPEEEENVLVSTIPLQIRFSSLRVSRDNTEEAVLLSLLLNMEDDLGEYADEPIVFAFFGRGRILPPLVAGGITTDNILGDCTYLCGACSCQVKRENPGIDALFTADWDAAIEGGTVVIDKVLPPLSGAGDIAASESPNTGTNISAPVAPPPPPLAESAQSSTFPYSLPITIGVAVVLILIIASLYLQKRSR